MASTRIHIDEARLGRVQKQDRIATGVLTAIVAIVMLVVISMVAYILFEGISTLFQPGFLTQPARANGTQGGVLYQLLRLVLPAADHSGHLGAHQSGRGGLPG